jgi:hypothetical protein
MHQFEGFEMKQDDKFAQNLGEIYLSKALKES